MNTKTNRLNRILTTAVALLITILGSTACASSGATPRSSAGIGPENAASPSAESMPGRHSDAGDSSTTTVARLARSTTVHANPNDASPALVNLGPKNSLGSNTSLVVLDQRDGWLHVSLPVRPNGSSGWIHASDTELRTTDYRVDVDLEAHTMTVKSGETVAVQTPVAIGAPSTPTPTGDFFITDILATDSANGSYGPYAIGLSGHSDKLTEFAGGDGQIGIHGTNDPSSIGRSASHGCLRVPNEVITALSSALPLGTPVTIH